MSALHGIVITQQEIDDARLLVDLFGTGKRDADRCSRAAPCHHRSSLGRLHQVSEDGLTTKFWRLMGFMATGGPAVRGHAWNFLSVSCHHSLVATVRGVVPAGLIAKKQSSSEREVSQILPCSASFLWRIEGEAPPQTQWCVASHLRGPSCRRGRRRRRRRRRRRPPPIRRCTWWPCR
jgi:hypothetical protein